MHLRSRSRGGADCHLVGANDRGSADACRCGPKLLRDPLPGSGASGGAAVREIGNTIAVTRDDHDWLLELGRQQGDSRIMSPRHEIAQALIEQLRPPLSDGLTLPWAGVNDYVRFMPGKVTVWSGPTFSGKTAFLRQLMLHAL